jgi:hypothetical protein
MFAFPEFVIFTSLLSLLLTRTFPKLKLVSLTFSFIDSSTPVPLKFTLAGDSLALVLINTVPFAAPPTIGLNATLKFVLEPAASFVGTVVSPDKLKPVPAISALKIFNSPVPVFETLIVCVVSVLTVTFPKPAADGVTVIARVPLPPPESPTSPQPANERPAANIAKGIAGFRAKLRTAAAETTRLGTQKPPKIKIC